jgi:hypothetical protein
MSITPKNWATFQHYKDRSPAWIKLHRGLLDDFTFSRLPVASRALAPLLWLLASEYEGGQITASTDELAFRFRMSENELRTALTPLINSGFFSASEPLAECKQDACLEKRERREREDIRSVAKATRPNPEFEDFKKKFPRRSGSNPWKPALLLFEKAVRAGTPAETINRGAEAYGTECQRNGIINTEKVAQAQTWLRQERYSDYVQPNGAVVTPLFNVRAHLV